MLRGQRRKKLEPNLLTDFAVQKTEKENVTEPPTGVCILRFRICWNPPRRNDYLNEFELTNFLEGKKKACPRHA